MTAAIARLPATTMPIVAVVPMRGAAYVIPTTISALIAAAVQSQTGWRAAAA